MKAYQAGHRRYTSFCTRAQKNSLPTSEHTLMLFTAHLAEEGLSHQTIKVYLSAVRNLHVTTGFHNEFNKALSPRLELILKGIKKESIKNNPPLTRLPITINIMCSIKNVLSKAPEKYNNILMWAACCAAFFGFLRCGEFTVPSQTGYDSTVHLSLADVSVDSIASTSLIYITIKQSKTDPFRRGATVCLAKTEKAICPVMAMLPYLALRGGKAGPLFILRDGTFLTRSNFTTLLRTTLTAAGIDSSKFASHSFRSGAATTAADTGMADVHIKMLGRWASDAYQAYVKTPPTKLAKLTKQLTTTI